MKLHEVLNADPMASSIEDLLWQDWQQDPISGSLDVTSPDELDDEEYLDFEDHVRDVVKFAKARRIRNPRTAIDQYTDSIRQQFGQKHSSTLH